MNRPLRKCPTCFRALDDVTRKRMGLRNGEILNGLCPGKNGPSDIDHLIHNKWSTPERIVFIEYKDGVEVPRGQQFLHESLRGHWREVNTGREIEISVSVLEQHEAEPLPALRAIVDWVWPRVQKAA